MLIQSRDSLVEILKEASDIFRFCSKRTKILSYLSWDKSVYEEFQKSKFQKLPKPAYSIPLESLQEAREHLKPLQAKIQGDHPVLEWLRKTYKSYELGIELLSSIKTPRFFEISSQLYGHSRTKLARSTVTHLELSHKIRERMSISALNDLDESWKQIEAEKFAKKLQTRIDQRDPNIPVKVELSDAIASKVIAGQNRVRIRKNATFSNLDIRSIWNHEIETHCLTAHNGSLQENYPALAAGGPRTTQTQEGLAVFFEIYGHSMSQNRFLILCDRIDGVRMAEDGASFLDVFRWYQQSFETPYEAFLATQRIFRGATVDGKYPFTKDIVYLAGLLSVYGYIQAATASQNRILLESLVSGRIALEDVSIVAWLRTRGIFTPPVLIPDWLRNWEALLSFFSINAVFGKTSLPYISELETESSRIPDWPL